MSDEEEESKGFQVRDRRRFTETGEAREESGKAPEPAAPVVDSSTPPDLEAHLDDDEPDQLFEITLSTFLMSLSTQALMCLGEIPNPISGQPEPDLLAVRELIDIINMLQQKTSGNLDPAEARLFEKILYDLRMRFVEKARK